MKHIRIWAASILGAALLAACGGSDPDVPGSGSPSGAPTTKGTFTSVVSFGDSLSDAGTYTPATPIPGTSPQAYFGGKFTTNNGTASTVWVENVATALGLVTTPAEMGFNGQSQPCPAAAVNPAFAATCKAYGQGGSRVTDPQGIGKAANGQGALTVPVKTQIANHLARVGNFTAGDLILVFAGNNDVFVQFGAFSAAATVIGTDFALGRITAEERDRKLFEAQTAAQAEIKKAALELAGYVRTEILAKGGRYVAVWNLPDSALTPFGAGLKANPQTAAAVPVLTGLVDVFNLWLREGLTNQPVQIVDANSAFRDVYLNPTKYSVANNTTPACDPARIEAITGQTGLDGSSLFCNAGPVPQLNGLRAGADPNTWQFADGVHPTTLGHKLISDHALASLRAFGWI